MNVHVKGYLTLKDQMLPMEYLELFQNSTLRDLLRLLPSGILESCETDRRDFESRRGQPAFTVLINGHAIGQLPAGLDTPINEGDEVAIFPPIAGGRI